MIEKNNSKNEEETNTRNNDMPYVIIKCAMSLDGYLDDTSNERLILSGPEDFERVDEERSKCDAILVGAQTLRNDNPRLTIKSEQKRSERKSKGMPEDLLKITVTSSGNLSEELNFFTHGDAGKIVYCAKQAYEGLNSRVGHMTEIVSFDDFEIQPEIILRDLKGRGVNRLMVEGGGKMLTMFISKGFADEIQLSVAPFFVGEECAPKFVRTCRFINDKNNRLRLKSVEMLGDVALLTYLAKS